MFCKEVTFFFELIQVAIGSRDALSDRPTAQEWQALYELSVKQALAGVCFAGVERLPKEQRPPTQLLLMWFGIGDRIKKWNRIVSARACELGNRLKAGGLRTCVLKGQGVASYYKFRDEGLEFGDSRLDTCCNHLGSLRQSGDIDVWVDGKRDDTIRYMRRHYKCGMAVVHHIDVEVFRDVPVEVHFIPSYAFSLHRFWVYKQFFGDLKEECFAASDGGFSVPSLRFNLVYLLMHIYRHVFHEGIGLRQLMDYYFVLAHATHDQKAWAMYWLERMGLNRFAAAVMYVEQKVFGLADGRMLCGPDEKAGRFLLDEIMRAGNFGQHDPRIQAAHSGGLVRLYINNVCRLSRMIKFYPSEVLWAPFWKAGHWVWRKAKGY